MNFNVTIYIGYAYFIRYLLKYSEFQHKNKIELIHKSKYLIIL